MHDWKNVRLQQDKDREEPAGILREYAELLAGTASLGPVLDLAGGDGRNAVFLARMGLDVVLVDRSADALSRAERTARKAGVRIRLLQMDLEMERSDPLEGMHFGAVVVFRYLHRPLIPGIRRAVVSGGIVVYETFTVDHAVIGKPSNPDFLLERGELLSWFSDWEILHWLEGWMDRPKRAIAQIVCRKP